MALRFFFCVCARCAGIEDVDETCDTIEATLGAYLVLIKFSW